MAPRKSTALHKFGNKCRMKQMQLKSARDKRWTNSETDTMQPASTSTSVIDDEIPSTSATEIKFSQHLEFEKDQEEIICGSPEAENAGKSSTFLLVDVTQLSGLVMSIPCTFCGEKQLKIIKGDAELGFAAELFLKCSSCNSEISKITTSNVVHATESTATSYEVTKRFVTSFLELGVGYSGLLNFCMMMGMKCIHHKTFYKYTSRVADNMEKVADNTLDTAVSIVRSAYGEVAAEPFNENDIIDIAVTYDGTWMKRGHTSNYGLGAVIDLLTGLVIDFQVMSKYCHKCAKLHDSFKNSPEYSEWMESHKCDKNYEGTSGGMEVAAALKIWKRSIEKYKLRYSTILSDGDSKTFMRLCQENIYGSNIQLQKEECINHVSKRMGTALRKVITENKALGISLGGKGKGKLTQETINKLTTYYQRALFNNLGDVDAMRNAVYATMFHAVSTDEDPHHLFCPRGEESWCFFNRAIAKNEEPGKHEDCVGTPLTRDIGEKLLPIYGRLTNEDLLRRCLRGKTQNANESLHSVIWSKCPKTKFVHRTRLEMIVSLAVSEFNRGRSRTVNEVLHKLGVYPNIFTTSAAEKKDQQRLETSLKRSCEMTKKRRKARKLLQHKKEEQNLESEGGPSYASGEF